MNVKEKIRENAWPLFYALKKFRALPEDLPVIFSFVIQRTKVKSGFWERIMLVLKCYKISYLVDSPHMENEMLRVMSAILDLKEDIPGVVVEAGSYKGSSAAKISWAVKLAGRKLFLFDSFEGMPENKEEHGRNIFGGEAYFPKGSYEGSIEEVKRNISRFGVPDVCEFKKGWFLETMPEFKESVAVSYIDVDLESSTRTCIKYIFPLLPSGGKMFSQDGHLPLIVTLLQDNNFWQDEVGVPKPEMVGLGKNKLVEIRK